MDIDLLWYLGGYWFLIIIPAASDCMATAHRSSSSVSENTSTTKSHSLLLFLTLLFLFLVLVHSADPSTPSTTTFSTASSATSTMNLHPKNTPKSHSPSSKSTRRQFEAGAHEVPSGPNPIQNR